MKNDTLLSAEDMRLLGRGEMRCLLAPVRICKKPMNDTRPAIQSSWPAYLTVLQARV